jgi:hypothetical protein
MISLKWIDIGFLPLIGQLATRHGNGEITLGRLANIKRESGKEKPARVDGGGLEFDKANSARVRERRPAGTFLKCGKGRHNDTCTDRRLLPVTGTTMRSRR